MRDISAVLSGYFFLMAYFAWDKETLFRQFTKTSVLSSLAALTILTASIVTGFVVDQPFSTVSSLVGVAAVIFIFRKMIHGFMKVRFENAQMMVAAVLKIPHQDLTDEELETRAWLAELFSPTSSLETARESVNRLTIVTGAQRMKKLYSRVNVSGGSG